MDNSLTCPWMSYVRSLTIKISAEIASVAGATISFMFD